jgi:branched-chain amino acid aminotransferase
VSATDGEAARPMPAAFIQANTNGTLHAADAPAITPLNRGFLYGDAIYEVWRTFDSTVFAWREHYDRLERSARALHLTLPRTSEHMFAEVARTVAAFRGATAFRGDVYIRLQVSRGGGAIGLDVALADRPEFSLLVQPCPENPPDSSSRVLKLSIALALRRNPIESLRPAWKTGNYLNNILCLREARARGADDVVMLNLRGEVTEAATSNLAFVRDGEVVTPRLDAGILEGITRGFLLATVAPRAGIRASETVVLPKDLAGMKECFLLGTTRVITPVSAIDDLRFEIGADTIAMRLKAEFTAYMRESAAAHPELKV